VGIPLSRSLGRRDVPETGHVEWCAVSHGNPGPPSGRAITQQTQRGVRSDHGTGAQLRLFDRPLHFGRTASRDSRPGSGSNQSRRAAILDSMLISEHAGAPYPTSVGSASDQQSATCDRTRMVEGPGYGAKIQGQDQGLDASPFRKGNALGRDRTRTQPHDAGRSARYQQTAKEALHLEPDAILCAARPVRTIPIGPW